MIGDFDEGYTRTGTSLLSRWSSALSFIPFFRNLKGVLENIPIIGGTLTAVLGYAGTIVETFGWLLNGQVGSALTAAAAGTVATTVNAFSDTVFWWANALTGMTTGQSLGNHARALTESMIGGVTGALGMKPEVLQSHTVGIGSIGGGAAPQQAGPGYWASRASQERGQNANEAYTRYMSGEGGVHLNELSSATAGRA